MLKKQVLDHFHVCGNLKLLEAGGTTSACEPY